MAIPTELTDGRTYYDFTISARDFSYASKAQTRAAIMRELRHYRLIDSLNTTAKRSQVADTALADEAFLRKHRGQVIAAVARDVVTAHLQGRWG